MPLQDVPLRAVLSDALGLPVFVDNDATVAALAEAHDEHGRLDVHSLVMFTVGTGVGGGIVIDGHSYRGATGAAGELGMTLVAIDERIPPASASFPQPGSLESMAAGHVLDRLAREAAQEHPNSALGGVLAERGAVGGPDAVAAAMAGDAVAVECVATLGRRLGVGVANAINTFDPQVVAIGGGVSSAGGAARGTGALRRPRLRASRRRNRNRDPGRTVRPAGRRARRRTACPQRTETSERRSQMSTAPPATQPRRARRQHH